MYSVAIIGESLGSQIAALACQASGFSDIARYQSAQPSSASSGMYSLGANASRVLRALAPDCMDTAGVTPDRYQVRFAKSAYLLAELPLGEFYHQRYGSPLINVNAKTLHRLIEELLGDSLQPNIPLADAERRHDLTIVGNPITSPPPADTTPAPFSVFHASLPDHALRRANVLWRGKGQYIEQMADAEQVYFRMITPSNRDFDAAEWHHSLQPALDAKVLQGGIEPMAYQASDTLFGGRVAYLSDALTPAPPSKLDAGNTGLEDAWVLSRMMENYEEDIGDGLAAFERFRRPRHRRVAARMREHLLRLTQPSTTKRFQHHLGTALKTRLLPEIALQQQDWLYEHDVIKGFR